MAVLLFVVSVVRGGGSRLVRLVTVATVMAVAAAGFVAAPVQAFVEPGAPVSAVEVSPSATVSAQVVPESAPPVSAVEASPTATPVPVVPETVPPTPQVRGDVRYRRGVPVKNVNVSRNGRRVSATVFWNQRMIARKGHRDRFNVRLVAFGKAGAGSPIVLKNRSKKKHPPLVQNITIKLSKKKAKKLRASSDVALAVSQQYGRTGKRSNKFFRQYATVTDVTLGSKARATSSIGSRSSASPASRASRNCRTIEITPGANLSNCDLSRAKLSVCSLARVNLTGANLTGTVLRGCNLNNTKLAGADLTGVVSGAITGTPASLPQGWSLINGAFTTAVAPSFTSTNSATAVEETLMAPFTVATTGVPTAAISITSGTMPTGVSLTDNGDGTATITGTPADGTAGDHVVTLSAANGISPAATQTFTLTVAATEAPAFTSPNSATAAEETAMTDFVVTTTGVPDAAISITAGSLPTGVSLTDHGDGTATMSGTPADGTAGDHVVTLSAANGISPDATQSFTLTVTETTAPAFTSPNSATAVEETAMTDVVVTTTGVPDAIISITAGTLPTGVSLTDHGDGTATMSGTPANGTAGDHVVTLSAANGISPDATQTFTLTVTAAPACVVGTTGPGGGTIFYDDTAGSGKCFEAAPDGWNTATPTADPTLQWGVGSTAGECGNLSIETDTGIGTGAGNTTLITGTAACDTPAEAPAPWAAKNYTGGSQTDWFLPSKDELNQLCKWARGQSTAAADQATVCDSTGTLAAGFTATDYWSSSQNKFLANSAWVQYFVAGFQGTGGKGSSSLPVRPIRAF